MVRDGAHCRVCGTGMIVGGHCNNSSCVKSPSYTPGGKKKGGRGRRDGPKPGKSMGWVQYGILLAVVLIALSILTD